MSAPATYRAMQVTPAGHLTLTQRHRVAPAQGEVLIRVEACGVCGADLADIRNADASAERPRVPGHEVVGRIIEMGPGVGTLWRLGQRVGVGRLGGHCGECGPCRQGYFQRCINQAFVGATRDGGYADLVLARHTGLVSIPDELSSEDAAPILCAGIATFNALRECGAGPADTVAIVGIGGLGHMAVQYARRMGFRVVAIGRGADKGKDAVSLGAHAYIDATAADVASALRALGGAQAIISAVPDAGLVAPWVTALAPGGSVVILGAGKDPLSVPAGPLVAGERTLRGSLTGSPFDTERALDFSVLTQARPMIETFPLEQANEALARLRSGDARYRIVLTMLADASRPRATTKKGKA